MQPQQHPHQQPQQPQHHSQHNRTVPSGGSLRLKQNFLQFKSNFNNVIKQMATDLSTSAEELSRSGSNNEEPKRPTQAPSTETLLRELDTSYSQLEYNLALLHRTYIRQQQSIQLNQSTQLFAAPQQPTPGGTNEGSATNLRGVVDRLTELLKPPSHLKVDPSQDAMMAQQQQQQQKFLDSNADRGIVAPPSNDSACLGPASVHSLNGRQQAPTAGLSNRSNKESSSSSASTSSRNTSTDNLVAMKQDPLSATVDSAMPPLVVDSGNTMQAFIDTLTSTSGHPHLSQQLAPGTQPRKHLIDIGYDSDSDESDQPNAGHSRDSNDDGAKLLSSSAMDIDDPHGRLPNIVDETSISLPVPDGDDVGMTEAAKPSGALAAEGAMATPGAVSAANEDSMSMIFSSAPSESVKVEMELPTMLQRCETDTGHDSAILPSIKLETAQSSELFYDADNGGEAAETTTTATTTTTTTTTTATTTTTPGDNKPNLGGGGF